MERSRGGTLRFTCNQLWPARALSPFGGLTSLTTLRSQHYHGRLQLAVTTGHPFRCHHRHTGMTLSLRFHRPRATMGMSIRCVNNLYNNRRRTLRMTRLTASSSALYPRQCASGRRAGAQRTRSVLGNLTNRAGRAGRQILILSFSFWPPINLGSGFTDGCSRN